MARPDFPFECFCGFLLDDFSPGNGGTLLIPGSHQIVSGVGEGPLPPLPPTFNVTAPAGSCEGSVALSLCTTAHPVYSRPAKRIGTPISETTELYE